MNLIVLEPDEDINEFLTLVHSWDEDHENFKRELNSEFEKDLALYGLSDDLFQQLHNRLDKQKLTNNHKGTLLSGLFCRAFKLSPPLNKVSGDGFTPKRRVEIKTSENKGGKYALKNIRPHHDLTDYLIHLYDLDVRELSWYCVPVADLYYMIDLSGQRALMDGSALENENKCRERELSLHPHGHSREHVAVWCRLQEHRLPSPRELYQKLHSDPCLDKQIRFASLDALPDDD